MHLVKPQTHTTQTENHKPIIFLDDDRSKPILDPAALTLPASLFVHGTGPELHKQVLRQLGCTFYKTLNVNEKEGFADHLVKKGKTWFHVTEIWLDDEPDTKPGLLLDIQDLPEDTIADLISK